MKKKLFENINGNQFKLIKESDWETTQQHNGAINSHRRSMRAESQYITAALESPAADEEVKKVCKQALEDITTLDEILAKGYLDSGYQYDDLDTRNQADLHGDRYWDDSIAKQRTGSNKKEEIEAEIRHEITKRHLEEHMKYYKEFFTTELAQTLFPNDETEFHGMSLSDYLEDVVNVDRESHDYGDEFGE